MKQTQNKMKFRNSSKWNETMRPLFSLKGCPCLGCPFNESGNDECLDLQKATECSLIEDWVLRSFHLDSN